MSANVISKDFTQSAQGAEKPLIAIDMEGTLLLPDFGYNTDLYRLADTAREEFDVVLFSSRPQVLDDAVFLFGRQLKKGGVDNSLLQKGIASKDEFKRAGARRIAIQIDDIEPAEQGLQAQVHFHPDSPELKNLIAQLSQPQAVRQALRNRLSAPVLAPPVMAPEATF